MCFSLNISYSHESLPLKIGTHFFCRTPKVATLLLRSVYIAEKTNQTYRTIRNRPNANIKYFETIDNLERDRQIIVFTREPVERLLSGINHMLHKKLSKLSCDDIIFTKIIPSYEKKCSQQYHFLKNPAWQHVLPPLRCRCGMECKSNVSHKFLKLEHNDPVQFLKNITYSRYLPQTHKKILQANVPDE